MRMPSMGGPIFPPNNKIENPDSLQSQINRKRGEISRITEELKLLEKNTKEWVLKRIDLTQAELALDFLTEEQAANDPSGEGDIEKRA